VTELVRAFGPSEARRLTDEVKADAHALWRKLVALYEGGAHTALGYSSWGDYCKTEFDMGQSRSYQLLDAGRVANALDSTIVERPLNEAQARELVPLLDDEAGLVEVVREVRAEHGEQLTAEKVRTAVEKKRPPLQVARRDEGQQVSESDFLKLVTDALTAFGWLWVHFQPAQRANGSWLTPFSGTPGFPDICAVRSDRILYIELKAANGKLRDGQRHWLAALGAAGAETHNWRPSDPWPLIENLIR
jgi:hypothetical protein